MLITLLGYTFGYCQIFPKVITTSPNNCGETSLVVFLNFKWIIKMAVSINITKRNRKRKLSSGEVVIQPRFVLNWRDPHTDSREQRFFERLKDAQEKRAELMAAYDRNNYSATRPNLTVADAVKAWLDTKKGTIRENTFRNYEYQALYVIGPLPTKDARRTNMYSGTGKKPNANTFELLGHIKAQVLTTRDIRTWHKLISEEVSVYTANKAMMILKAALALAAEDHEFRPPAMPTGLQRRRDKERKKVLSPDQISLVLAAAKNDLEKGIYFAAPFLMGTRPSEQLGLLWDEVDFDANVIRISRIQMMDGSLAEVTKTNAGRREIPMSSQLREMLLGWRLRCPRNNGKLERVFPALGHIQKWPLPRRGGGGPLIINNFRTRFWAPALKALGLPAVSPHSARHSFISTLQAQGVEVGLVAKIVGHKNAVVTLSHYTHAMRGGNEAIQLLDRAFSYNA